MGLNKKIISLILIIALVAGIIYSSTLSKKEELQENKEYHDSLVVWYSDEAMTDYFNSCAVEFHEKYGIRVLPKLQPGGNYIEDIYTASMENSGAPDLYLLTDDALEKAYTSGCACEIEGGMDTLSLGDFSLAALDACIYKGSPVAYPLYFETSALLYNKTYLLDEAKRRIKSGEEGKDTVTPEEDKEVAEIPDIVEDSTIEDNTVYDEAQLEETVRELIPGTFDELLAFADNYTTPAEIDTILKWDVKDILYNYFFVGNYINVGGRYGDDNKTIDIYNIDSIKAMMLYQDLNQFLSFDYEDISYDKVIDEFIQGKMLYTTAATDIIAKLKTAVEQGEMTYEYGLAPLPDLSDELKTKNISVTDCLVVNGYSDKREWANDFARFCTFDNCGNIYEKAGKIPSNKNAEIEDINIDVFLEEYEDSQPMPKMMVTSNFWLMLETAFENIWSGESVSLELKQLSEQMKMQLTGESIQEEYIPEPEVQETVEYLDEEELRQEALEESTGKVDENE